MNSHHARQGFAGFAAVLALGASVAFSSLAGVASAQERPPIATAQVRSLESGASYLADGQVESVRQTVVASQVSGQVTALAVRAGDAVKAGQLLVRIDARAAEQNQAASAAQLAAARAQLTAAERNLDRTLQLVAQKFLSASTLDRAQADQRAAAETVKALRAQTAGAATQTGWHTVVAPFDAVISSVTTEVGDTAMPGRPLMQLYDPAVLRVAVNVPAGVAARLETSGGAEVDIPDAPAAARRPQVSRMTLVAAADPVSHTQLVRLDLLRGSAVLTPGLFARVRLPLAGARESAQGVATRVAVPLAAVVSRGDLRGVYVAGEQGSYLLRQVRLGRIHGEEIEVLSGLSEGERVALDPIVAARVAGLVGAGEESK